MGFKHLNKHSSAWSEISLSMTWGKGSPEASTLLDDDFQSTLCFSYRPHSDTLLMRVRKGDLNDVGFTEQANDRSSPGLHHPWKRDGQMGKQARSGRSDQQDQEVFHAMYILQGEKSSKVQRWALAVMEPFWRQVERVPTSTYFAVCVSFLRIKSQTWRFPKAQSIFGSSVGGGWHCSLQLNPDCATNWGRKELGRQDAWRL